MAGKDVQRSRHRTAGSLRVTIREVACGRLLHRNPDVVVAVLTAADIGLSVIMATLRDAPGAALVPHTAYQSARPSIG